MSCPSPAITADIVTIITTLLIEMLLLLLLLLLSISRRRTRVKPAAALLAVGVRVVGHVVVLCHKVQVGEPSRRRVHGGRRSQKEPPTPLIGIQGSQTVY